MANWKTAAALFVLSTSLGLLGSACATRAPQQGDIAAREALSVTTEETAAPDPAADPTEYQHHCMRRCDEEFGYCMRFAGSHHERTRCHHRRERCRRECWERRHR